MKERKRSTPSSSPARAQQQNKKRPRASKSLLMSFKPGSGSSLGAMASGSDGAIAHSFVDAPSTSLVPSSPPAWSPASGRQPRAGPGMGSPAAQVFGRERSPSVSNVRSGAATTRSAGSAGGSGGYLLRRSRSNSNLDTSPSALQMQLRQQASQLEDLVWKRKANEADPRLLTEEQDDEEMVFLPHEKPSRTPVHAPRSLFVHRARFTDRHVFHRMFMCCRALQDGRLLQHRWRPSRRTGIIPKARRCPSMKIASTSSSSFTTVRQFADLLGVRSCSRDPVRDGGFVQWTNP